MVENLEKEKEQILKIVVPNAIQRGKTLATGIKQKNITITKKK